MNNLPIFTEPMSHLNERLQGLRPAQLDMPPRAFMRWAQYQASDGKMTREQAAAYIKAHREYRRSNQSGEAKTRARKPTWTRKLLKDLRHETQSTRSGIRYYRQQQPPPLALQVLEQYMRVLERVAFNIKDVRARYTDDVGHIQTLAKAVIAYNRDREREGKPTIPNGGEHWCDWVPAQVQAQFQQAWLEAFKAKKFKARWRTLFYRGEMFTQPWTDTGGDSPPPLGENDDA